MTDVETEPTRRVAPLCPWCRSPVDALAKVCAACGASRRRVGGSWTSPREARRNDMILAAFGFILVCILINVSPMLLLYLLGSPTVRR